MPDRFNENRILRSLSEADLDLIAPHLVAVDLPARHNLERPHRPTEHIHFIKSGIASVVAYSSQDHSAEVVVVGCEGLTGLAIVLEADSSPNEVFMQVAGSGWRITKADVSEILRQSETLRRSLLRYAQAFAVQASQTAVTHAQGKVEERLARWLLMAADRIPNQDLIPLTHEFLSLMLGVRRAGVTVAIKELQSRGLITAQRSNIIVIDRAGLEERANGFYGVAKSEFERLFEPPTN